MHIAVCPECASECNDLKRTVSLVQGVSRLSVSDNFDAILAARVANARQQHPGFGGRFGDFVRSIGMWNPRPAVQYAVACTSAAVAIVVMVFVGYSNHGQFTGYPAVNLSGASSASASKATDTSFVAACTSVHAQDQATQPIADPSAEALAERIDNSGSNVLSQD